MGGDVITNANLQSNMPAGFKFILDGTSLYPGNAIFGGSSTIAKANLSSKGWGGNTMYQGKRYDSVYFNSIVPTAVVFNNLPAVISNSDLSGGTVSPDGYFWFKAPASLTLSGDVTITGTRKIILFVEGTDFNVNGKINIQTKGQGFFMAIVSGNINVNSALTGNPTLEGIYEADGNITTGSSANSLYVRGNLTSWGSVSFQRNLGAGNNAAPAETIEYAPDLTMLFPRSLIEDRVGWQEVLP